MAEFRIVPRTAVPGFDPVVRDSKGRPRPRLSNCRYLTGHWTGAGVWGDEGDTLSEIAAIEFNHARPNDKPNEYNYVIHQEPDDEIHEYAGEFMAAHSEGENPDAVGVLFLNGVNERITDIQVRKWQWLRDQHLIPRGILVPTPDQRGHGDMPGAATGCPGWSVRSRWPEMLLPYTPVPSVPSPTYGAPMSTISLADPNGLTRLFDSRASGQVVPIGGVVTVPLGATTARAAFVTVTAVSALGAGYVQDVWAPATSCLNYAPGQTIANTTVLRVSDGKISVRVADGATHLLLDLVGVIGD